MPYIHVFPPVYRSTDILFSLADRFIEFAATGKKCSYGRGKGTPRAVQVTALYVGIGLEDASGWQDVSPGRRLPAIKHVAHVIALQMSAFDENSGIVSAG